MIHHSPPSSNLDSSSSTSLYYFEAETWPKLTTSMVSEMDVEAGEAFQDEEDK